jgi:2-keto-4-pentenoate hydratase
MDKNKLHMITQFLLKKRLNNYYINNDDLDLIPKTQEEAYFVQNKIHSSLNSKFDSIIGRKIGCTTKVMQDYLQIDHPCAGTLRKSNCFKSGDNLNTDSYTRAGVECEIAVKLSKDLPFCKDYSQEDIYSSIGSIFPAIEVVDDRYSNWKNFTANHLIADDFFSSGCVLGVKQFKIKPEDIVNLKGVMYVNNKKIGEGYGKHILGNPLNALKWLTSRKDIIGTHIPKNSIILLGSLVETFWVSKGDKVKININDMESISINFI